MAVSNLDEFTWVIHCLISQRLKNCLTRELSKDIIKVLIMIMNEVQFDKLLQVKEMRIPCYKNSVEHL